MTGSIAVPAPSGVHDAPDRRELLDLVATMSLALYSFVAALGLARAFTDWQFVTDALVVVLVGHGASLVMRRLGVPGLAAVALTAAALVWSIAWMAYPTTFAAVFPTRETWDIAWADLGLVRDQFQHAVAPVEYVGGWSLLAMIGIGFAVLAGDTFAFHARARGEALVPSAVLFVFVAALGADRHRLSLTLALIGSGFATAAVLRMRFAQPPRTFLGGARHPLVVTLPAAALAGAAVVAGAWAVGPRLPGASAEPLVDTHNDVGGVTEVISPLVDIRARLVNRADTQLFAISSAAPAYWRVTACPSSTATPGAFPTDPSTMSTGPSLGPHPDRPRTRRCSSSVGCAGSSSQPRPSLCGLPARACAGTPRRRRSSASTVIWRPATSSRSCRQRRAWRPMPSGRRRRELHRTRSTSSCPTTSRTTSRRSPNR